ncbi:hypothetical protein BD626DRAFT_405699 [Schizophyllum amplum]|uniref:Uncharacterized protein n=1 Tax=Schizophyllum amplum TaxID=97359 RepID=A0A550C9N8_9AGAR|nr:hypothetical protein BD626DRAFT_405699 [Auriculariopsis ampla]
MDERTRVYNEKLCLSSQSFVSSANILSVSQTPVSPTLSKAPCDIRSPVPPPVTTPSFPYSPSPPPFLSSHSISSGPLLLAPSPIISRQYPSPAQTLQRDRIFQHPLPHLEPADDCFSSNAALHWT